MERLYQPFEHLDGIDLLKTRHLSDEEGWKFPPHLIPHRDFPSADRRPAMVRDFGESVNSWDAWHRWRKLPKESISALIMSFPLSVHQLLVNCLKITSPDIGSETKRVPLYVHILGVEVELNYLPVFSELALLLPYHDIKLVMFGYSVHKLKSEAQSKASSSLAGKSSSTSPVFTYIAPKESGSGSLEIFLCGDSQTWSQEVNATSSTDNPHEGKPDALIACNAGLASYPDWIPVVQAAYSKKIPFATTEYAEQSAEHQRSVVNRMMGKQFLDVRDYSIDLNPFQSPGQRPMPSIRMPNVVNGFTLVVVKKS